jgi:hypothetical protein
MEASGGAHHWAREMAAMELTRSRRRSWGERKREEPQCQERIHHMKRNTGVELSSWRARGVSINELAREFEPSANAIREWVKQAELDEGQRSDGPPRANGMNSIGYAARTGCCVRNAGYFQKPRPGVCHERERELVMLYRRWESASRSRPAGAGFKPPGAAALKRRGGERPRKSHPQGVTGTY